MSLELGVSSVYLAAVDINNAPLPASEIIPAPDATSTRIAVQCVLSARLVGDDTVDVTPEEWDARRFNPAGILNWAWRVTGKEPGNYQLQLELRPAVVTANTGDIIAIADPSQQTTTFVTQAEVRGSWPQNLGHWWNDNWPAIVLVIGGVAGAVIAGIKWGSKVIIASHSFRAAWRGNQPQDKTEQDEAEQSDRPATKRKKYPKREH
ncbi:hypothetical protein [Amycolatopsis sp. NPDC051371]|uniref:hypothetical protein n=1 Tax=Amycolatopsis sp. NPDC051371 TaxID=3155800 RepID=UPI00343EAD07